MLTLLSSKRKGSIMQEKKNGREDAKPFDKDEALEEKRELLSFLRKLICSGNFERENVLIEGYYTDDLLRVNVLVDMDTVERSDAKDETEVIEKYFYDLAEVVQQSKTP